MSGAPQPSRAGGSTGERINYALRPAKHIERRMLVEVFQRLAHLAPLASYRYVGFGSFYFSDFMLVHRTLGVEHMHSIERDVANKARFEFNKPFRCITMHWGESFHAQPPVPWDRPTICWLDYDGALDASMLGDVQTVVTSAPANSLLLVTVNTTMNHPSPDSGLTALDLLRERVGEDRVPDDLKLKDLQGWNAAEVCRRLIWNQVAETLAARNAEVSADLQRKYRQLVNVRYADGARMVTVGGLLYDAQNQRQVDFCEFEKVPCVRTDDSYLHIEVPMLTYREIRHLDAQLPNADIQHVVASGVPAEDVKRYAAVYRYFPHFAETSP